MDLIAFSRILLEYHNIPYGSHRIPTGYSKTRGNTKGNAMGIPDILATFQQNHMGTWEHTEMHKTAQKCTKMHKNAQKCTKMHKNATCIQHPAEIHVNPRECQGNDK
jgi:hypothetical protein